VENLKIQIKIEDNDNLKEAHDLLLKLGFSTYSEESFGVWDNCPKPIWLKTNCFDDKPNKIDWVDSGDYKPFKEITLPELRDLVVLKRNDVGDANVSEENCLYDLYLTKSRELYFYHCGKNKWILSNLNGDDDYYELLKPIEKTMKEYLIKSSDGKYLLTHHDSIGAIEIPEGATAARLCDDVEFYKNDFDMFFSCTSGNWLNTISPRGILMKNIVWQRAQHPEELPFIDDEPSLNDQYAEIEKVRQSHRTASVIADSALKHIRERAETYDQPTGERSAAKTAKAFNAITGKDITESEVWLLLQLLKDVRQWSREDYHQDSAEDCIAYAALKAESLEGGE